MISRTIIGKEIARQCAVRQQIGLHAADIAFEQIVAALAKGEGVRVKGFGTFAVRHLPAREGRNPFNGEKIAIAASVGVSFKPHKALKDALNPERPRRLKFSVEPPPVKKVGGDRNSPMPQRKRV